MERSQTQEAEGERGEAERNGLVWRLAQAGGTEGGKAAVEAADGRGAWQCTEYE